MFGILVVPRESICGIWLEIILVMALVDVLVVVELFIPFVVLVNIVVTLSIPFIVDNILPAVVFVNSFVVILLEIIFVYCSCRCCCSVRDTYR